MVIGGILMYNEKGQVKVRTIAITNYQDKLLNFFKKNKYIPSVSEFIRHAINREIERVINEINTVNTVMPEVEINKEYNIPEHIYQYCIKTGIKWKQQR